MASLVSALGPLPRLLARGAAAVIFSAAAALAAQQKPPSPPDFQSDGIAWIATLNEWGAPPSGPGPVRSDPAHPYVPNGRGQQPTFRIADVTSPILKPWAAEQMRKENEAILAGKIAFTARSSCMPAGVPGFSHFIVEPVYFIQSPKKVLMVYAGDQQVRHIYMNVPHSKDPKPSWYGESVGRYEGDTLVIDTIGMNSKSYIDNYRTPHTAKLHVVERYRLVDDGKVLEVSIQVEDPDTFNEPWGAMQRYRRVQQGQLDEQVCAENNAGLFDYHIPEAEKADF